jgi:hypothetical protein
VPTSRLNKVQVRQLIADTLAAWLKWQTGNGSKAWFEKAVAELAATLTSGDGPQFRSAVWMQALRITDRWNLKRKVPYQMMRRLLASYEDAFW